MITRRDFLKVTAAGGALASLGSVTEAKATMQAVVPPVVNFSCRAFRISLRSDFPDGQNT
mgnify:CR=1 FL=1